MTDDTSTTFDDQDEYRTLAGSGRSESTVEGSRFLGYARPVDSEDDAEAFVEKLRGEHHDARHVCYGLRVGHGARRIDRSNDDGEPPRTGGFPIWQILSGKDLEDSLCVVVRYYGGTKLGTGGLKRAYSDAARAAIEDAGAVVRHPEVELGLTVPYDAFDELEHLVETHDATRIIDRDFGAAVELTLAVWQTKIDEVRSRLGDFLSVDPDSLDDSDRN